MYAEFWNELLIKAKQSNGHFIANCPFCHEEGGHFYGNIATGLWDCKRCGAKGNSWTFLRDYLGLSNLQIAQHLESLGISQDDQIENQDIPKSKVFDKKAIEYYCSRLTDVKLAEFAQERGLSIEILKKYSLGVNYQGEFTLPVYDEKGLIRDIKRRSSKETISSLGGEAVLFGVEDLLSSDTNELDSCST